MPADSGETFDQIFNAYYQPLVRFFAGKGVEGDSARDLAQEALYRAYRAMPSFEGKASQSTWLFTIATNLWKNQLRAAGAEKRQGIVISLGGTGEDDDSFQVPQPRSSVEDPLGVMLESERRKALRSCIENLPPRRRRAISLRIYRDLQYEEIAAIMMISVNTVKALIFQAKQKLREELSIYYGEIDF